MMVRRILHHLSVARVFVSKSSSPILPVARFRTASPLLIRPFHRYFPSRAPSPGLPPSPTQSSSPSPNQTFSQRLKHLIKSYGWYALGMYLVLSTLDFGVAFAVVNILGADSVTRATASLKESVQNVLHSRPTEPGLEKMDRPRGNSDHAGNEGLYAMLVLAYTIHKTVFLPVRVGLTAALTPRLVGWLTRRGWAGRGGAKRAAQEMRDRLRERS